MSPATRLPLRQPRPPAHASSLLLYNSLSTSLFCSPCATNYVVANCKKIFGALNHLNRRNFLHPFEDFSHKRYTPNLDAPHGRIGIGIRILRSFEKDQSLKLRNHRLDRKSTRLNSSHLGI